MVGTYVWKEHARKSCGDRNLHFGSAHMLFVSQCLERDVKSARNQFVFHQSAVSRRSRNFPRLGGKRTYWHKHAREALGGSSRLAQGQASGQNVLARTRIRGSPQAKHIGTSASPSLPEATQLRRLLSLQRCPFENIDATWWFMPVSQWVITIITLVTCNWGCNPFTRSDEPPVRS